MKKILYFAIVLVAALTFACCENEFSAPLEGKWRTITGTASTSFSETITVDYESDSIYEYFEFFEDGKFQQYHLYEGEQIITDHGNWESRGSRYQINSEDLVNCRFTYTIKKLTMTELVLKEKNDGGSMTFIYNCRRE